MKWVSLSALALAFVVIAPTAAADVQWRVFQLRREQCFNSAGEYTLEQSIHGCSELIRMRSIDGDGRAQAFKLRGDRYRQLEDFEAAEADYTQVIRMRGDHPGAYYRRSEVYLAQGRYPAALDDADATVRIAPDQPGGYRVRCQARLEMHAETAAALNDCNTALEYHSSNTGALSARGVLYLQTRRYDEAWADFDAALLHLGPHAHGLYGRGLAAQRLGRPNQAGADIARALELDPEIAATYAGYGVTR